jgi:hypothetical protein
MGLGWGPGHSTRLNNDSIELNHDDCCYNKANQQMVASKSLDAREIYISQRQVALNEARYVVVCCFWSSLSISQHRLFRGSEVQLALFLKLLVRCAT